MLQMGKIFIGLAFWNVVLFGVTIWLADEHQARLRLGQENVALRQQLGRLAGLVAENERLSNILAQAKSPQSLPDERLKELLRLRGEAGVLRERRRGGVRRLVGG